MTGCYTSFVTVTAVAANIPTNVLFHEATVHVVSGTIRRSIGGEASAQTPLPTNVLFHEATVHVVSGTIRRSIGGEASAQTPLLSAGDSEEIRGRELLAYRVVREGAVDAQLCIEYRTLAQPTPPPPVEEV
ncbi:hypothetical protein ASF71_21470 [Deinococcus sp. Leaf326]|nr:hypothetical protein ASF71_21470 [Deinococcus sp. Leaf326]